MLAILIFPSVVNAKEETLYNTIKGLKQDKNYKDASGVNGIYTFSEGDVDYYHYYGKDVDNHALIGNVCFEIIRTTDSKGVKLIYDGLSDNGKCDKSGAFSLIEEQANAVTNIGGSGVSSESAGYMVGESLLSNYENKNDSYAKAKIDEWYKNEFIKYSNYIEDTIYCNDRSIAYTYDDTKKSESEIKPASTTTSTVYFGFYRRAPYYNNNPILTCALKNDRFTVSSEKGNGALTYPVGMLTADEAILSGAQTYDTNSYLYDSDNFLLMTPNSFYLYYSSPVINIAYITRGKITSTNGGLIGLRPVVSVKSSVVVKSGDGKEETPYVLGFPEKVSTSTTPIATSTTSSKEIQKVEESVKTGIYDYLWLLPIIGLIAYVIIRINNKNKAFR